MNKVAFYGSIWTGDPKEVVALLQQWVHAKRLDVKSRLSGEEIVYEDNNLYLYCYTAVADTGSAPSFLLEGNLSESLDESRALLLALAHEAAAQNIPIDLEYVEVNEEGEEVSEQFQVLT